jgi:hypothetical protein
MTQGRGRKCPSVDNVGRSRAFDTGDWMRRVVVVVTYSASLEWSIEPGLLVIGRGP